MKRMMSIVAIALMVAGSVAYACDTCGCTPKKAEKKAECSTCPAAKKCADCTAEKMCAACTAKAAEAAKAEQAKKADKE